MISQDVLNITNPYEPVTHKLTSKDFKGRQAELDIFRKKLENYYKTLHLENFLITGEKSIGKSTLLHRFKSILNDNNFTCYETDLTRDESSIISEFEFFFELIDDLFNKFGNEGLFDSEQTEIWYTLTNSYYHSSSYMKRKLRFPTAYANYKLNHNAELHYSVLEKDICIIIDELTSKNIDLSGLAILIDEFQEITKNIKLLNSIKKLSENLEGLVIIAAGFTHFIDDVNFEKFCRISVPFELAPLNKEDILNLIFGPIENAVSYKRHEIQKMFDPESIYEIINRTEGNPLHIKLICAKMFEYIQQYPYHDTFHLNRNVMEKVIEAYSQFSNKSYKIRSALATCTREKLDSFNAIYKYNYLSLKSAIYLEAAFDELNANILDHYRKKILDSFYDIWDLNLFEFNNTVHINDLYTLNLDKLSDIQFYFIGDAIDKLYTTYFYEALTERHLEDYSKYTFEDVLALKLSKVFNIYCLLNIHKSETYNDPLTNVIHYVDDQVYDSNSISDDFNLLRLSESTDISKLSKEKQDKIIEVSKRHKLDTPSQVAHMLNFSGYYVLILDINIKGKRKLIYNYYPVMHSTTKKLKEYGDYINKQCNNLHHYFISINDYHFYYVPNITLYYIVHENISNLSNDLFYYAQRRDFDNALSCASKLLSRDVKLEKESIATPVFHINNYAFCLINLDRINESINHLHEIQHKYNLAKLNLAYSYFCLGYYDDSINILKKIVRKKIGIEEEASLLNATIPYKLSYHTYKILENCTVFNVACWNLALIHTVRNSERSMVNRYLKQVTDKNKYKLDHYRIISWVCFLQCKRNDALNYNKYILDNLPNSYTYYLESAKFDYEIYHNVSE